ncbi:TauD/TfdA family dioxygenase, partial [Xylella fastidiosa]
MKINIDNETSFNLYNEINKLKAQMHDVYKKENIILYENIIKKHLNIGKDHQKELRENGYIEFLNLPIDRDLCNPPELASRPYEKDFISEIIILGCTKACGVNPFGYHQEKNGALIHEITPVNTKINSISSEGVLEFKFHTDGAYLPRETRPHTLSLMCLEDTHKTATNIVKLNKILSEIDETTKIILAEPRFIHTAPETFKVKNINNKGSILEIINGQYEIKAALHNIKATDSVANNALNVLKKVVDENIYSKFWEKGDLIIFNNLKCMHGRGQIKGKRWLQRCYGSYYF